MTVSAKVASPFSNKSWSSEKEPTVAELRVFGWIRPIVFAHKAAEVLLNLAPINEPLAMVIASPVVTLRFFVR